VGGGGGGGEHYSCKDQLYFSFERLSPPQNLDTPAKLAVQYINSHRYNEPQILLSRKCKCNVCYSAPRKEGGGGGGGGGCICLAY